MDYYLDGRSWKDFSIYCYVYKGRLIDKNNSLNFSIDYHDFYKESLYKDSHILYDSHIGSDNDNFKWKKIKRVEWYDDLDCYDYVKDDKGSYIYDSVKYKYDYVENNKYKDIYGISDLEDKFVIDENSHEKFRNFDKLYDLINIYSYRGYGVYKQAGDDRKLEMKSKMKLVNSLYNSL